MSALLPRGIFKIRFNAEVNDMTREERIKGAVQEFMAKHERQGKRTRKRKSVKLFSVDEPQREREERRKGE